MRNKIINCSRTCALLLLVPFSYYFYYAKCRPTTTEVARLVGIYIYNISQHSTHFSLAPIEISVTAILVEFYCIPSTTALCSCMYVLWCVCVWVCECALLSQCCSLYCGLATFVMRPELCSLAHCGKFS